LNVLGARTLIIAALTIACTSTGTLIAWAGTTDPLLVKAQTQYHTAEKLDAALNEMPLENRSRAEYLKVINAYQRVYLITPKTGWADNALMRMAALYEETGDPADALKTLGFLIHEYPSTPFMGAAERDVARLRGAPEKKTAAVENVRYWDEPDSLRVIVDLTGDVSFKQGGAKSPDRVFVDVSPARLNPMLAGKQWPVESDSIKMIRVGQYDNTTVRVVLDIGTAGDAKIFKLTEPDRLVIDVPARKSTATQAAATPAPAGRPPIKASAPTPATKSPGTAAPSLPAGILAAPVADSVTSLEPAFPLEAGVDTKTSLSAPLAKPTTAPAPHSIVPVQPPAAASSSASAQPAANPSRSLIRSLGLKLSRVVIDAGHGGHDTGSIGPSGYTEKEFVLDVATRLKELIEKDLGTEVVMTRDDDTFVPLETRTAIANQQKADLFISIHANSSGVRTVQGVETFFLNLTSSRESAEIAGRENAASEKSIHEVQDLAKKIMLQDKVEESRELAQHIQKAMAQGRNAAQNRGVKQAPFVVLIGADMPSILAEIGFISNPQEERSAKTPAYRQQIAEALFKGVKSYADTLSGLKTARSLEKN
jgi:N-acetylmuramoyl-L-alanine amidase